MMKPAKKTDKEVIINAESLETRVAVLEKGRLEEFTIERTTEERLVGSIFKGKVRNLEDATLGRRRSVDIGFLRKNAFLQLLGQLSRATWTAASSWWNARPRRGADRPKITQKDIPRLYPPGSDIIVQLTKGPIGTNRPRVTTNLVLPGRYLVLLPNSDQCGISRKIENGDEPAPARKSSANSPSPAGWG